MPKVVTLLSEKDFLFLAALLANRADLAAAAEEGGADALVVSTGASDFGANRFGNFELEEEGIRAVTSTVSIPVGLYMGDTLHIDSEEWERVIAANIDFLIMFAHQMPILVLSDERVSKFAAIGPGYVIEQVRALSKDPNIDALVAALTPSQAVAQDMTALDLGTLRLLVGLSEKPVLNLLQKIVEPRFLPILARTGCKGVILNSLALGSSAESVKLVLADYRSRILV
ncbi:MAG: hypothetical protein HA494_03825 [Thaumarchaeota archaeon]|nr:hypothetical protein [Nitrososphaerota archaeon]